VSSSLVFGSARQFKLVKPGPSLSSKFGIWQEQFEVNLLHRNQPNGYIVLIRKEGKRGILPE
jgi:hypothetical protein